MDESFYLCQQGTGTDLAPLQYPLPFPSVPETGSLLGLFREESQASLVDCCETFRDDTDLACGHQS